MSRSRYEEVIWLYISMDPSECVGFLDAENHFSNIPLRNRLSKYIITDEQAEEIPARHVVHDEVKAI
jgi:hypothetical protein